MRRCLLPGLAALAATLTCHHALADNAEWCTLHRNESLQTRGMCADKAWCAAHWNDDRISRIACDPFKSNANLKAPALDLDLTNLADTPLLNAAEMLSECWERGLSGYRSKSHSACQIVPVLQGERPDRDNDLRLLPPGMNEARLALRADFVFGWLPVMHVRIGLLSPDSGTIWVNTARSSGPRQTRTARLTRAEIGKIIGALDRSQFWQLPEEGGHQPVPDGEGASIEVSISGHKHHVLDAVDPAPGAVDLSILARATTTIIFARWKDI